MNKRFYLIILMLTYQCIISNAQTNVSGFISANTTWNLAGSPYIVVGNALLSHGYTLTIEPGVVVKFETDKALQIDGELIAVGTPQNSITFTSNQVSPAAGDWGKIHFPDTCVDATFDSSGNYLSGSIMKYCDIFYGGSLGFGEIHIENASPFFNHCRIFYSSTSGIYGTNSIYLLDSSSVKNCSQYGLEFHFSSFPKKTLIIQNDTLSNNSSGGIWSGGNASNSRVIRINNNYFESNTNGGAIWVPSYHDSLRIYENYFINNSSVGSAIVFLFAGKYIIECNHFVTNQSANGVIRINQDAGGGIIRNNIFYGNTSSSGASIFSNLFSSLFDDNLYFENNWISNNISVGQSCCYFEAMSIPQTTFHIKHNEFINNTASSIVYVTGPNTSNSAFNFIDIKYNNFQNPSAQYELYNDIPYGSPNIYADSNYWGTTNTQHIDSVIYDYFDFANQSVVYYSPILTTPAAIDTTCPAGIPTFVSNIESVTSSIHLFPNPATKQFTIAFDRMIQAGRIEVCNILGKEVLHENIYNTSQKEINIHSISNGIYLVRLFDGERYFSKKLIVQHD